MELKRVESAREVAEEKIRGKRKSCMGSFERGRGRVVNRAVRSGIVSSWWKPCWAASGCAAGWRRGFGLSGAESDGSVSSNATWGIQVSFQGTRAGLVCYFTSGVNDGAFFFITFCSRSHSHRLSERESNGFWSMLICWGWFMNEWRHLRISPFLVLCVVDKPHVSGSRKLWFNASPRWWKDIL